MEPVGAISCMGVQLAVAVSSAVASGGGSAVSALAQAKALFDELRGGGEGGRPRGIRGDAD